MYSKRFQDFLKEIAPYVVVVGSFAKGTQTAESDIDLYIRHRPLDEVDCEISNETYIDEVIATAEEYGYRWDSICVGCIAIYAEVMLDCSTLFKIPISSPVKEVKIGETSLLCAEDDKEASYDSCYEQIDDSGNFLLNPLPDWK